MTQLLVWHTFNDAVKEGDSNWIIDYWKFLLVMFRVKEDTEIILRRL